ncbi:MAG: polysaccharide deacetylase family protein [Candidatus Brocadiaceae bacterium]|nr:polysaccharide deacetylase family protein [Candidatus Brocadiaceae bacterium]
MFFPVKIKAYVKERFGLPARKFLKLFLSNSVGLLFRIVNNLFLAKTLTVFVYHDVSDNPSECSRTYNLNVPLEVFNYQINFIRKNFNVISPADLLESRIPSKAALITFDDGFQSYFKNALPILEKHNVPSIIFLNMGHIRGTVFWPGLIIYLCEKRKDFREYVKNAIPVKDNKMKPLFLYCSRNLVDSYIERTGESFEGNVAEFVGEIATEEDLIGAAENPMVFYGNHLLNHDIPALMSDEELLKSYLQNADFLKRYLNYRDMFSFPFGQPGTCYNEPQVRLILESGAKKVFSSTGRINRNISSLCLDRIALTSFNESPAKIWFQVFRKSFRKRLGILSKEFNG